MVAHRLDDVVEPAAAGVLVIRFAARAFGDPRAAAAVDPFVEFAGVAAEVVVVGVAEPEHREYLMPDRSGALSADSASQNELPLSGGSPSPVVAVRNSTVPPRSWTSNSSIGREITSRPASLSLAMARSANSSVLPVWEAHATVTVSVAAASVSASMITSPGVDGASADESGYGGGLPAMWLRANIPDESGHPVADLPDAAASGGTVGTPVGLARSRR